MVINLFFRNIFSLKNINIFIKSRKNKIYLKKISKEN